MKILSLFKKTLPAMFLASMAMTVLPACSSTEESEDCADRYSNEIDIKECEVRQNTPDAIGL